MELADHGTSAMHAIAKALAIFAPVKAGLKPKNAFDFAYNVVKLNEKNLQQVNVTCVCCNRSCNRTGSYQIVNHFIGCPLYPREIREGFKKLRGAMESKGAAKRKAMLLAVDEATVFQKRHAESQLVLKQQASKPASCS